MKEIILLGCHRSGTSLVAGILDRLGVDMGDNMLRANLGNPLGYFEDSKFYQLNEKILDIGGGSWHTPPPENEILFIKENSAEINNEIKNLIDKKSDLWGWKDPRTSITAELYLPYLKDPHFIVVHRKDEEILESFRKRDGHNTYGNQEMIDTYRERIDNFFKKYNPKRLDVDYSEVVADPQNAVKKIAKFIGVKPNKEAVELIKSPQEIQKLRDEYRISEGDKYNQGAYHWENYLKDPFYKQHVDYVVGRFMRKEGMILDVGCGDGLITALLSQHLKATGIDINERAIELAKGKCKSAKFEVRDVFEMGGGFDYLLASEVIEHIPDPEKFILAIKDLFKKEALITTPNREFHDVIDPHHFREWNKDEFKTFLEKHFNEVQVDRFGASLYGWIK